MWHDITCNGALHCICMGTSHGMGTSVWLKLTLRLVIDWVGSVLWDDVQQGRTIIWNGKENMRRVIASRDRHPFG